MQCSSCHAERQNLREYSKSALDAQNRKTIHTQYLCAVCRIMLMLNPKHFSARAHAERARLASQVRRVA